MRRDFRKTTRISREANWARVRLPLALATVFFSTWGPGIQIRLGFDPSKIFVGLSVLLIACWFVFKRDKSTGFPRPFNLFVLFVFLHTVIAYGFFFRQEFSIQYIDQVYRDGGILVLQEAVGIRILRFALFVLFGYALSAAIETERELSYLVMAYGLGFVFVNSSGGYVTDVEVGLRYAGGVLDPNALGQSALVAFFSAILILNRAHGSPFLRGFGYVMAAFGLVMLIRTGSRGALVGFLAGLIVLFMFLPSIRKRVNTIISVVLLVGVMLVLVGSAPLESTLTRLSMASLAVDKGAGRETLWIAYITHFSDYWVTGVGFGHMLEVISGSVARIGATHNNYLGILVEFGIVGLALFLAGLQSLWQALGNAVSGRREVAGPVLRALFVAWLVSGFFLDSLTIRETWIVFGLVAARASFSVETSYKR